MGAENDHEQCKVLNTEIPGQRPFERITPGQQPGVVIHEWQDFANRLHDAGHQLYCLMWP